jgi:hypothetical protein
MAEKIKDRLTLILFDRYGFDLEEANLADELKIKNTKKSVPSKLLKILNFKLPTNYLNDIWNVKQLRAISQKESYHQVLSIREFRLMKFLVDDEDVTTSEIYAYSIYNMMASSDAEVLGIRDVSNQMGKYTNQGVDAFFKLFDQYSYDEKVGCIYNVKYVESQKELLNYIIKMNNPIMKTLGVAVADRCRDHNVVLNKEQENMLFSIITKPVTLVNAKAGRGKTFVLQQFKKQLVAIAPTNNAVVEIKRSLDTVFTIDSLFFKCGVENNKEVKALPKNMILAIDEISMISAAHIVMINKIVKVLKPVKIVLVGDHNQLKPVGQGSFISYLLHVTSVTDNVNSVGLIKNMRTSHAQLEFIQNYILEKQNGSTKQLMNVARKIGHKSVEIEEEDYMNVIHNHKKELDNLLFLSLKNETVDDINNEVYNLLFECSFDPYIFIKGERRLVYFSDPQSDLYNGQFYTVTDYDGKKVYLKDDYGLISQHDSRTVASITKPGYASTVHKSQGKTINTVVFVLKDAKGVDKSLLYTAITRAKEKLILCHLQGSCSIYKSPHAQCSIKILGK